MYTSQPLKDDITAVITIGDADDKFYSPGAHKMLISTHTRN